MCKCCQSCLESCYWHLIEKHFCYDENIALYEEPEKEEKNNNLLVMDNAAFYDSVAVIAGRSVVTIDPLPEKPKPPIVQQPMKKLRWWESDSPYESNDSLRKGFGEEDDNKESPKKAPVEIRVEEHEPDSVDDGNKQNEGESTPDQNFAKVRKRPTPKNKVLERAQTISTISDGVKSRKQSLHERRLSRSLTLHLDSHVELPIVRQASVPKFYLDTPEENQMEKTSMFRVPSSALTSPVLPNKNRFNFDLSSVVQMENEKINQKSQHVPVHGDTTPERSTRLAHFREKLNPLKIIRQGSMSHLPHASHHM